MFKDILTEKLTFVKADGTIEKEDVLGRITEGKAITFDTSLTVKPNDRFLRNLPNGFVEEFIVQDPGFQASVGSIKAHFQSTVQRSNAPPAPIEAIVYNIVNNISGPNARVNINSTDNSHNTVVSVDKIEVFEQLREALKSADLSSHEQTAIEVSITEMETANGTASFKEKYQKFISVTASHIGIFTPFLATLTNLL